MTVAVRRRAAGWLLLARGPLDLPRGGGCLLPGCVLSCCFFHVRHTVPSAARQSNSSYVLVPKAFVLRSGRSLGHCFV
jgi:hypothetical protein